MTPDTDTQTDPAAVSGHEDVRPPPFAGRPASTCRWNCWMSFGPDRAELERSRTWVIEKAVRSG